MIKIRVQGLPNEVEQMIADLKTKYHVLDVSSQYRNRNSGYVRVYLEIKI